MDAVLKTSIAKKTMDNITVVFVAFKGFEERINQIRNNQEEYLFVMDEKDLKEVDYPSSYVYDYILPPHAVLPGKNGSPVKTAIIEKHI